MGEFKPLVDQARETAREQGFAKDNSGINVGDWVEFRMEIMQSKCGIFLEPCMFEYIRELVEHGVDPGNTFKVCEITPDANVATVLFEDSCGRLIKSPISTHFLRKNWDN